MTDSLIQFQVDPTSVPSLPCWMEEVAAMAHILTRTGIRSALQEHVRFARARFGTYETIDFLLVLLGYALSGEPTIQAFYERLTPFRDEFAALFERQRVPSRSALSRFLAALPEEVVEALSVRSLHTAYLPFRFWGSVGSARATVDCRGCGWYQAGVPSTGPS